MNTTSQVEAARQAVLVLAHPDLATIVVTGKDRRSWLNGLVTCDLVKRDPNAAAYGLVVARNGRVMSDAMIAFDEPAGSLLMALPSSVAPAVRAHLDHYLVMEDAEMSPRLDAFESWAFHGPRADDVLDAARRAGAVGGAVDRTGLGGGFAFASSARAAEIRAAIADGVGAAAGTIGDDSGWEALRLERAVPRFALDFDEKTYPQEAALERTAVSFDKGCYLGQEVICMLEMRGHVKRKLVSLVLEGREPPARGAVVSDESGAPVGEVTSAAQSPTLGRAVALAIVKRAHAEAGQSVLVAGVRAKVVERPA
jgi:tRNA-modifying protein YgfZ